MIILNWVVIFLVIAMLAVFSGFGGISIESNRIAKTLFFIFLVVLIVSLMQDQGWIEIYR
jgi:uncharacterized membrane protein YtjA (UPF0391 family)